MEFLPILRVWHPVGPPARSTLAASQSLAILHTALGATRPPGPDSNAVERGFDAGPLRV